MLNKRSSKFWLISKEQYIDLVNKCNSFSEMLRELKSVITGSNIKTLKKVLNEYNIDYSKIKSGLNSNKGRKFIKIKYTNDQLFTENSTHARQMIKKRIIKEKLIPHKCAICGQEPIWNGKELVLVLDHINGINNDHRLENLRFLCPNCNAQQDTFCGKNSKTKIKNNKEKERLKELRELAIKERIERILNSKVSFSKYGWVEQIAKLENISHTAVKRFMRKYMKDFYYTNCHIRKNQFDK